MHALPAYVVVVSPTRPKPHHVAGVGVLLHRRRHRFLIRRDGCWPLLPPEPPLKLGRLYLKQAYLPLEVRRRRWPLRLDGVNARSWPPLQRHEVVGRAVLPGVLDQHTDLLSRRTHRVAVHVAVACRRCGAAVAQQATDQRQACTG